MQIIQTPRQIVTTFFLINGLLFGSFVARLPAIQNHFALNKADLGLALLALALGAVVSFPFSGRLADKFGTKKVSYIFFASYVISPLAMIFARNHVELIIAFILYGAVHGGLDVAMNAWAGKVEKEVGRNIMSNFHANFSLGAGLGALLGAGFSYLTYTFQSHFVIISLLTLPILYFCYQARHVQTAKPLNQTADQNATSQPKYRFGKLSFILLAFIAFANAIGEGAMADWSAIYTKEIFATNDANAALSFAAFSVSMVIMRLIGDQISQKLGKQTSLMLSSLISFTGVTILLLSPNLIMGYMGFFILGFGYALIIPLVFSTVSENNPDSAATAIANISIFAYGGLLLGPPIIGFVAEGFGLKSAFTIFLFLSACSAIAAFFYKKASAPILEPHQKR